MPYDETVAQRLRGVFAGRDDVVEKKMFGGIAFMMSGKELKRWVELCERFVGSLPAK